MQQEHGFSRRAIDQLGRRLKAGEEPREEDLDLLARYQESLFPLYLETRNVVGSAFAIVLPGQPFEPSFRIKQYRSIASKLRRMTTKLSSLQDLIGFRVVVTGIVDQDRLLEHLPTDDAWSIKDRRLEPSHGYRAVHVMHRNDLGTVEVQVRTLLQHHWAELSELLDRISPGTKYGKGRREDHELLDKLSWVINVFEAEEPDAVLEAPGALEAHRKALIDSIADIIQSGRLEYP